MRGRWDAKYNPRDHGIARNFGSGLREWKNPIIIEYPLKMVQAIFTVRVFEL